MNTALKGPDMRKRLLILPAALLVITACGSNVNPAAPETTRLQPAEEECGDWHLPC